MYQTVIFDLDGTLLDTLQDLAATGNHTLAALGLPTHPVDDYKKMVGGGIPNLIKNMLPEDNRGDATFILARSMFESYYAEHMQDLTAPYPGIPALLDALGKAKVRMGISSNKSEAFTQKMVESYFPKHITATIGLREGFLPKPDRGSVDWLMQKLQASPDSTLFVGDSDVDMRTAMNAGLPGCGVLWGFRERRELELNGARFIVENPGELQTLILDK